MSALVRSELLKVRTTRARFVYPVLIALLAGLGAAGTIGGSYELERSTASFQAEVLVNSAGVAALITLILGITIVTNEFRHGTITPTFLVTPVRERVVAAKTIVAALFGVGFALLAIAVTLAVTVVWLNAEGHDLHLGDHEVVVGGLRVLVAAAMWGALGAAVGSLVHSQIGALVGALVWLLVVEHVVIGLLSLADWERAADYLPGRASGALADTSNEGLGFWTALAVALAYLAVIGALGVLRTNRRDIT